MSETSLITQRLVNRNPNAAYKEALKQERELEKKDQSPASIEE